MSSGVRVANRLGLDIGGDDVEGYLPESVIKDVEYRAALRPASPRSANVILHGVVGFWPFADVKEAPLAVVLLDLLESSDERSRRAARAFARR